MILETPTALLRSTVHLLSSPLSLERLLPRIGPPVNRRISRTLASLAPALVLAAGMLAGTAVAAAGTPTPGSAAVGGLLLVASVLVCGELVRRRPDAPRGMRTASVILALCFSLALAIVGARDAARVSEVLPLLGAGAVVLVLDDGRRARCNRRGHELEPRT